MKSELSKLLTARQREIDGLRRLAPTSELVGASPRTESVRLQPKAVRFNGVHSRAIQPPVGVDAIFLGSDGDDDAQ